MRKDNWKIQFDTLNLTPNEMLDKFFINRNIKNPQEFLTPNANKIYPFKYFENIEAAGKVLLDVIHNEGNILIYADVDTDGCCAAAIVKHYLDKIYNREKVFTYINHGKVHGVTQEFLSTEFYSYNVELIIIVDSINDTLEEYNEILTSNTQLIILDHHIPKSIICQEAKTLNLVSSALNYPNPHLSGSGVAWKFIAYIDTLINQEYAQEFLDLAATGIIADVCNVGSESLENRAICNIGFNQVINSGLRAIVGKDEMTSTDIAFSIAPLINAANRSDKNLSALNCLLSDNFEEAKKLVTQLKKTREYQKTQVAKLMPLLEEQVIEQLDEPCYFFIEDSGANELTGLLATKLCAKYNRPCMVVHTRADDYAGSMRAKGVDDFSAIINNSGLGECSGHENSAGISIPKENLAELKLYLNTFFTDVVFDDSTLVDFKLYRYQLTPFLLKKFSEVNRITGPGFPAIRVCIEDLKYYEVKSLKSGKHLSIELPDLKLVYWNFEKWDDVIQNATLSSIGTIEMNTFRGKAHPQLLMEDYIFDQNLNTQLLY